jgi:hypothetical protein
MARALTTCALAGLACALTACGGGGPSEEELIRRAAQDEFDAIRARDADTWCEKTFSSIYLPARVARGLGVPPGEPGRPAAWRPALRSCATGFDDARFERLPAWTLHVRVKRIDLRGPASPSQGITSIARARFRGAPTDAPLVKFRGDWKMVAEAN